MKLSENDIAIMNVIWDSGNSAEAADIAARLGESKGWRKPTVYTLIERLIKKGAIERTEPRYICRALVMREEMRKKETNGLLNSLFGGSAKLLVSGFIKDKRLTEEELRELRVLIDEMSEDK